MRLSIFHSQLWHYLSGSIDMIVNNNSTHYWDDLQSCPRNFVLSTGADMIFITILHNCFGKIISLYLVFFCYRKGFRKKGRKTSSVVLESATCILLLVSTKHFLARYFSAQSQFLLSFLVEFLELFGVFI